MKNNGINYMINEMQVATLSYDRFIEYVTKHDLNVSDLLNEEIFNMGTSETWLWVLVNCFLKQYVNVHGPLLMHETNVLVRYATQHVNHKATFILG